MQKINLLPVELRKDPTVDVKRIIKIAAFTTIVGILVLAYITLVFNNYLKEKEIETIRAEIAALQPKVQKVETLKKEIALNHRRITIYQNILYRSVPWPEILRDLAFNSPTDLWFTEIQTSRVEVETTETKSEANKVDTEGAKVDAQESTVESEEAKTVKSEIYLIIKGYSPSLTNIGVFILHLNQLSTFEEVNLVTAKAPGGEKNSPDILEYEIKTKLKMNQQGGQK